MKIYSNQLKRIIHEELSLLMEGCGEAADTGGECPTCSAGHECPCDDDHDHDTIIDDQADEELLSRSEALQIVSSVAQNTSCPVTRDALMDVVDNLSEGEGEEWSIGGDDDDVDVDWSNPQYGHFRGDIGDLESKDDAFGVGFSMGQSGDFPQAVDQKRRG